MGRIAKVISTNLGERNGAKVTDVKADPGGGAVAQADQFNTAGDDSHPLPGDYAIFVELPRGGFASAGNLDPKNAQTAQPGERRIYGRDSSGAQVCEIHFKNDGEVTINNGSGFITLLASGTVDINGFTIAPDGTATSPTEVISPTVTANTSLTINGVEMDMHTHPYTWTDPAGSGNTGGAQ